MKEKLHAYTYCWRYFLPKISDPRVRDISAQFMINICTKTVKSMRHVYTYT